IANHKERLPEASGLHLPEKPFPRLPALALDCRKMQKLLRPIRTNRPRTQKRLPVGILPDRLVDAVHKQEYHIELRQIPLVELFIFLVEPPTQFAHRCAPQEGLSILID